MKAMVLERPGEPLVLMDKPDPQFAEGQVLVACPRAEFVAPIFTSLTGNFPIQRCRLSPGTRLLVTLKVLEPV